MCPPGLEPVVAAELAERGFRAGAPVEGGVPFEGDALQANRLLATPTRILLRIKEFPAKNFAQLQAGAAAVDWAPFGGLTPEVSCHKSRLYHSDAVAQRLAAVVPPGPGRLQARLVRDRCTLSVDTSGARLHQRGWRVEPGPAPLRETLAACLLRLAGWAPDEALLDPMCGAGTFLIEAATWAAGRGPGALRSFACEAWLPPAPWPALPATETLIAGGDRAPAALGAAARNAARAGVTVQLEAKDAKHQRPPAPTGLLVCNPPYGHRVPGVATAYERLGELLAGPFAAWRAAILTPDAAAAARLGRRPAASHPVRNGGLGLRWLVFEPAR